VNTAAKLAAYGAALVLIVTGAYAVGTVIGPLAEPATVPGEGGDPHGGTVVEQTGDRTGGLASSSGGYTLTPIDSSLRAAGPDTLAFRIAGPDGAPVTAFDVEHDKRMHLIVVRRDSTGFQHLHPEMAPDGIWRVPVTLPVAGTYRAFADFRPTGGQALTLGTDLFAPGTFIPTEHAPSRTATVDDYTVALTGDLVPGRASAVTLTVTHDGRPVTDLQPYLAAYGHLVALRQGDLAYLHVHPDGAPGDGRTPAGPGIEYVVEVPSTGTYRLFLDFRHGGVVRTAAFTVPTAASVAPAAAPERHSDDHGD
jgi:hypothetical protein